MCDFILSIKCSLGSLPLVSGISSVLDLCHAAAHQGAIPIQAVEKIYRLVAEDWFSQL